METLNKKKKKVLITLFFCTVFVLLCVFGWNLARKNCEISCTSVLDTEISYTEEERVINASALSFFVYGCEQCDPESGTVDEILKNSRMGIIEENFGIVRTDESDPESAVFDTGEFISAHTGAFRLLASLKSEKSGFYGVAFCDDEKKCVWIAYSGSITFRDALASAGLAVSPMLTRQEKSAFELFETVMQFPEIQDDGYSVMLTGHSLGGALASMVACVSGCRAVTVNGADGLAIDKICGILGEKHEFPNISNYMTSPEKGRNTLYDLVQRLMFLGSYKNVDYHISMANDAVTDTHCVFSIFTFPFGDYMNPSINKKCPPSVDGGLFVYFISPSF